MATRNGLVAIGVYEREVRVYADVLPDIDIPQPKIYSAIYEADGHEKKLREQTKKVDRFPLWLLRWSVKREQGKSSVPPCVLLIEDLADAEVGDQVTGGSPEKIAAGLSILARLHAATWGVADIPRVHWAEGPDYIPRLIHALYLNGHDEFVKKATPVIDWQTAVPGPVALDVGYLLVSSLHAETPESEVDELLAGYHAELVAEPALDITMSTPSWHELGEIVRVRCCGSRDEQPPSVRLLRHGETRVTPPAPAVLQV